MIGLSMGDEKKSVNSLNGDIVDLFRTAPKRKLSEIEKQLIFILTEKSKVQRELSMTILNQGFLFFAAFVIVAYLSKESGVISDFNINLLFILGIIVLVVSMIVYQSAIVKEKKILDKLLDNFLK
jgi:hypothetical protein